MVFFLSATYLPILLYHPYQYRPIQSHPPDRVSLPRFLFPSLVPTSHTSILTYTHQKVSSLYSIRMLSYLKLTCTHRNTITTFFARNHDREDNTPTTLVRFLHTFCFSPFPVGRGTGQDPLHRLLTLNPPTTTEVCNFAHQDQCGSSATTTCSCSFLSQDDWIHSLALDKGFIQQGTQAAEVSLIMNRSFSFAQPTH